MDVEIEKDDGNIPENGKLFSCEGRVVMRLNRGSEGRFLDDVQKEHYIAVVYISKRQTPGQPLSGAVLAVPYSNVRGASVLEQKEPLKLKEA